MSNVEMRIKEYVESSEYSQRAYDNQDKGLFRIVGGNMGRPRGSCFGEERRLLGYHEGTFIEALSKAVKLRKFYGGWVLENCVMPRNGYIEKVTEEELIKLDLNKLEFL